MQRLSIDTDLINNLNLDQMSKPVYLKYNWVSSSCDSWRDKFWTETELGRISDLKNVNVS